MQRLNTHRRTTILLVSCLLIFLACSKITINMEEKLVWESPALNLLVINQTSGEIILVPVDTSKTSDLTIAPDDTTVVLLKAAIYEVTDKKDKSDPKQVIKHRRLSALDETPFLFESGDEYALRIKLEGESHAFIIERADGWYEDSPVQVRLYVVVNGAPMIGIPAN